MNLREQLDALLDATAFDSTGAKVGAVRQVYVDDASGKITFATVSTGLFSADAIVPLHGARLLDDELHLDHTRTVIRDSPRPDNTEDGLTPEQEIKLLEYYGIEAPARGRATVEPQAGPASRPPKGSGGSADRAGAGGAGARRNEATETAQSDKAGSGSGGDKRGEDKNREGDTSGASAPAPAPKSGDEPARKPAAETGKTAGKDAVRTISPAADGKGVTGKTPKENEAPTKPSAKAGGGGNEPGPKASSGAKSSGDKDPADPEASVAQGGARGSAADGKDPARKNPSDGGTTTNSPSPRDTPASGGRGPAEKPGRPPAAGAATSDKPEKNASPGRD